MREHPARGLIGRSANKQVGGASHDVVGINAHDFERQIFATHWGTSIQLEQNENKYKQRQAAMRGARTVAESASLQVYRR
jgi:hypothetical protein